MASKKELVEAQSFAKRRLTTAFVAGAPGGREVEPHRPMRAVFGGLALTVVILIGSLATGLVSGSMPSGWENNRLIIAKESGARYVSLQGVLHPVANTTTARLLIPAAEFEVLNVREDLLAPKDRGSALGIEGAPDSLPSVERLIPSGWVSCLHADGRGVSSQLGGVSEQSTPDQATLVSTDEETFLVVNGIRWPVSEANLPRVLAALRLETLTARTAPASWTNLFPLGEPLTPITVGSAGQSRAGLLPGTAIGSVVVVGGDTEGGRYLVTEDGVLDPLTPLANALYRAGTGQSVPADVQITPAQLATTEVNSTPTTYPAWPTNVPTALDEHACAILDAGPDDTPTVALGTADLEVRQTGSETRVLAGGGALVRGLTDLEKPRTGPVFVIDQEARAYAVEGRSEDLLERLGYSADVVTPVPAAWLELFADGPVLSVEAAAQPTGG